MTISALVSGLPNRQMDQQAFDNAMALLMANFPVWATQVNTTEANMNFAAAGGAYRIPYTFDTATADADTGSGKLRLDNATQWSSAVIRTDLIGSNGNDFTAMLDTFGGSTSAVKGHILLMKVGDASKFLFFSVSAIAGTGGYRNISVAGITGSSATPFVNGDPLVLFFQRTGDKGDQGSPSILVFHAREEQASGTYGAAGTAVTGGYRRVLNTVKTNQIAGMALSGNQITGVPGGNYKIRARSPLTLNTGVQRRLALYDVTGSAYLAFGNGARNFDYSGAADYYGEASELTAFVTLASTRTLELRDLFSGASPSFWGLPASVSGQVEVYSEIFIEKIG
jgi:hypothetical protein